MGNGTAKTPAQWTADLWKIIDDDSYNQWSFSQIQQALACGASIAAPNRKTHSYMLPTVVQKRNLNATAGKQDKVQSYNQLIQILEEHASKLLSKLVVDEDCNNMNDIRLLVTTLKADCYQDAKYGPLGLLGQVLKKGSGSFELVQLLIENNERAKLGLGKREQDKSCIDIAKESNKKDIADYLQIQLNKMLNKMPFERNDISIEEINFWIVNGANTEWEEDGDTVLCKAVDANNLALCEVLVAAGANTSVKNRNHQTPVQIARSKMPVNAQLIKILESRAINDDLKSAIIHHDSIDDIRSILARGADIKASTNANQDTFLHLLILSAGSVDMVKVFVNEYNADINSMNVKGHRVIETAIVCDSDEETTCSILRVLFRLKQFTTDSFYNEKLKQSVLSFCDSQKKKSETRKLIQAELNQRLYQLCLLASNNTDSNHEKEGETIQELAKLVRYGAQIDHQEQSEEYSGWTVVHLLCRLGNLNLLKHVIETLKATTYNEQTTYGDYPISIAAEYGHQSIIHYLRDTFDQVTLNVSNSNGDTPLHKAAKNNHFLVVRYLIQWGADPQAINNIQQIPLSLVTVSEANKPMIKFLEHLMDTADDQTTQARPRSAHRPDDDFDFCQLVLPIALDNTNPIFETSPESNKSPGILQDSPNEKLFRAATNGDLSNAKDAIATGADVRYHDNGRSSYVAAVTAAREFNNKWSRTNVYMEKQELFIKMNNCNQVAQYLAEITRIQLIEAIKQGNAGCTMAFHQCGAAITPDLLILACQYSRDNAQIVGYLVLNDQQTYKAMYDFDNRSDSPYSMALKKKYTNIASYIKWKLTEELTNAVNSGNDKLVKQLLVAGASADMKDRQNLDQAIRNNHSGIVRALCEHGARLPSSTIKTDNPQIKSILKRYKLNHEFRKVAANGKLADIIRYHRQSADINAKNCHGATALLITIQSGEYYPIVHYLVSCGASMLHSDITQPSLLRLAEKRKYEQIFDYLSKQLNTQFLSTILDNDTSKTDALAKLGTNFNCTDEEGRTPLHYAVQYHGVDLVKWLCNSGSSPMSADQNGDYPITLAAEKGDYAVIEYFIKEHGATKQLKNKQGLDVLAIAKRRRFNEIVQLLDPGNTQFKVTKRSKIEKPKHTNERLDRAVEHGETQIVKEFIQQEYQSLKDKTEQCGRMMEIARQGKHFEVLSMLQPHYAELSQELTSNQAAGRLVNLSEVQLTMFYGFMNNLSDLITGNHVTLDPANPQTYKDLFSNIISTDEKRLQTIQSLKTPQDSAQFYQQELNDMQEKIENLNKNVGLMKLEKQKLTEQIHGFEKQLTDENQSAIDKKQYFKDKETTENALNALESSIQLTRHAHETAQKKKNLLTYIRTTPNLFVFYATIEHRLQSLFNGVLAAQSELFKVELSTKTAKVANFILDYAPLDAIPVVGEFMSPIKSATQWLVETLDKKHQKAEWYNISVLGNIEELQKAASTAAGLLTLYYNQQIQLIDTTLSNTSGSNLFSTTVAKTTELIQGTPEPESERLIVLTAEFISELLTDTLKSQDRKEKNEKKKKPDQIVPDIPLGEQLWLFIAKKDLLKSSKSESLMATTGFGFAKRIVPIRRRTDGKGIQVQVRQLFGYVSLITGTGTIYRTQIKTTEKDKPPEFDDVEDIFGYAYLDPFMADDETILKQIISGRDLSDGASGHQDKVKLLADDRMVEGIQALRGVSSEIGSSEGITKRMALSVGKVLENEKVFLKKDEVDDKLNRQQLAISYDVSSLREEIKQSTKKFQTSIDAAYEKIGKDFDDCTQRLQRDNQEQYQKTLQKITEQQKQLQLSLEKLIATRLMKIETDLNKKSDDMMAIANSAKQESQTAVRTSNAAQDSSIKCEKEAKTASEKAEALVVSTDQRKKEMQQAISDSTNLLKKTIDDQKQAYQTSLDELQKQMKTALEILRVSAQDSSKRADDADKSARETARQMRESVENQKRESDKQAKNQKDETDKLIKSHNDKMEELLNNQKKERRTFEDTIKEMTRKIEQALNESQNAARDAKRAADASEKTLKKAGQ